MHNSGPIPVTLDEDVEDYRLVYFSATGRQVSKTAATTPNKAVGVIRRNGLDTESGTLYPLSSEGTQTMVASAAITVNAQVVQAADGKIQTAVGLAAGAYVIAGRALQAASADLSQIEVLPERAGEILVVESAQESQTDAGALDVTSAYADVTTTGAAALTLPDGLYLHQTKTIQMIVDGGDATLTPDNLNGGTTIVFADAGDRAVLDWDGAAWTAIELSNMADGATAPVLA